jgi:toxin ParE1/3/4
VRLSSAAESDFREILRWTRDVFGGAQAATYAATVSSAVAALSGGPSIPGARPRPDVGEGLFTLHVARKGRKGRHFVLFRVSPGSGRTIDVLRLLHEAMDLPRHVSPDDESG